jgi:beta-lactamase class A
MQEPENPSRPPRRRPRRRPPQQQPKPSSNNAGNVRYLPGSSGNGSAPNPSSRDLRPNRPTRPGQPIPSDRSQISRARRTAPDNRPNNARFNLRSLLSSDTPTPRKDSSPRLPNPNGRSREGAITRVAPSSRQIVKGTAVAPLVARPKARVAPTPIPKPRRVRKVKRPPAPPSPLLYVTRLLILGIGIGAIAGTVLSIWNPKSRVPVSFNASVVSQEAGAVSNSATLFNRDTVPKVNSPVPMVVRLGQPIPALTTSIQRLIAQTQGFTVGVHLVDLDTGNYVNVNGDTRLQAASTIKVPVLVSFLQDLDAGKVRLDQNLTMEKIDVATEAGEMQYLPVGTQFPALEVATKMITVSDNTATNILIRQGGGMPAMNQRFRSWGLTNTSLSNLLPDLGGTNTVSAKDLTLLLTSISQGNLLSLRSRDRLLEIMRGTVTDTLIPAGIGPENNAVVAHKTGTIGTMVGDTGIVDMTSGKRYVLTIIVQRQAGDDAAQELIRQISGEVYQYFASQQQPYSQTTTVPTNPSNTDAPAANDAAPAATPEQGQTP